ncbi:MAG: hypothetical protein NDI69_10910 [Bacteriovoracaceae bacterium]|nr:hypothetical protein [Bacteriovoracaceae bacterium]
MFKKFKSVLVTLAMTTSTAILAQEKGPVTPTSVTYIFNSAQLTMMDDDNYGLFQSPVAHTFKKSDPDFANQTLKDITIGYGRYKSISLCYNTNILLTIHAAKYNGRSGALINKGDYLFGQANGKVSTVNPGTLNFLNVSVSSLDQNCTTTYFKKPLCVVADGQNNNCETGDDIFTAEGQINPNTGELDLGLGAAVKLQISLLMDMLNGVIINADTGEVTTVPKVSIVLGDPGAAIHLGKWDNNGATDVSMIFSNDKTLLSVVSSEYPGTHSPGFCNGQSNAFVSSVPTGSPLPVNSINFITFFDELSGNVSYPVVAACPDENNCSPVGFNLFDNVIQEVSSIANVRCVDENDGGIPSVLLDYGYTSVGSGEAGLESLEVQRIVDPTNLLGICTSGSLGYMAGKTGVCTFVGSDVDGY